MTRKLFLFATAFLLVISAGVYGQKLQKSDVGIQLPKTAQRQIMTSVTNPEGNEYWEGYSDFEVTNFSLIGMGGTPRKYGVAMCFPAKDSRVEGKVIKGIRFALADKTYVSNVKVFMGTSLETLYANPDICSQDVTELVDLCNNGLFNYVQFDKPYIVDSSKPVYIGYRFDVTGGNGDYDFYPVATQKFKEEANSLFMCVDQDFEWYDYSSSGFGVALINVLLDDAPIFEESFANGIGQFTMEGAKAQNVWTYTDDFYFDSKPAVLADGYYKAEIDEVSYLVSPTISLRKDNAITFDLHTMFFSPERVAKDMMMSIRTIGGEWTDLAIPNCNPATNGYESSGQIVIPSEFDNQDVQIAFKYTAAGASSGMWYIRNLVVGHKNKDKADPNLSFSMTDVTYYFGNEFTAPVLNNPNGVDVTYSSSNPYVVFVDPATGQLYFNENQGGYVTITATSAETDQYKASSASYNINVLLDPKLSFDITDVRYNVGETLTVPSLNNPNNLFVEYESSNPEKVYVNYWGDITVLDKENISKVTITAKNYEGNGFFASSASYVITVIPENVYVALFDNGIDNFNFEGGVDGVWNYNNNYISADAYGKFTEKTETRLVSPVIQLDAVGNKVSFEYISQYFSPENIEKEIMFSIREVGGKWVDLKLPVCILSNEFVSSGEILIPSYFAGKEVQIAAKYIADGGATTGILGLRYFLVKKSDVKNVKVDPAISFNVTEVNYVAGEEFVAPVLDNYYGVGVSYTSSNNDIARAIHETGEIKFYGEGTVTITARTFNTELFKESVASYTLTITIPTGIDGVTAEDFENGKVYDLQGRKVNKAGKGVYIVNGKKVVVK